MTSKFHWTLGGVLWLAGQLSGLSRAEMPGVMAKALESAALNDLRDLYIESCLPGARHVGPHDRNYPLHVQDPRQRRRQAGRPSSGQL